MKPLILLLLVQSFFITTSFASDGAVQTKKEFNNCIYFKKTDGAYHLSTGLIDEISSRSGLSFVNVQAPIKRCIQMMITGEVDSMLSARVNKEREKWIDFLFVSEGLGSIVFYTRKSDGNWLNNYSDLQGKKIGVTIGFSYFDKFDHDDSVIKVRINNQKQLAKLLSAGRVDAYITYSGVIEDIKYPKIVEASYSHPVRISVMAISKGSELQVHRPLLEEAIKGIISDGTMDKLTKIHLLDHKKPDAKVTSEKHTK